MEETPVRPPLENLPAVLPVFPLRGVILLPGSQLPLNVFEPRYRNMTLDALGAGRLIGMIQPRPRSTDDTALFPVGCAGRITVFSETEDGRFLIVLTGLSRFRIARELGLRGGYRRVEPEWSPFREDLAPSVLAAHAVEGLLDAARGWASLHGVRFDPAGLRPLGPGSLVDVLAMNLPFDPEQKQALLEAPSAGSRAELLRALLELGGSEPAGSLRH